MSDYPLYLNADVVRKDVTLYGALLYDLTDAEKEALLALDDDTLNSAVERGVDDRVRDAVDGACDVAIRDLAGQIRQDTQGTASTQKNPTVADRAEPEHKSLTEEARELMSKWRVAPVPPPQEFLRQLAELVTVAEELEAARVRAQKRGRAVDA